MKREKVDAPNWSPDSNDSQKYNRYQPYSGPVDDQTIMAFGKNKGLRLIDVPASWFIWYKEDADGIKNYWLIQYIENNWDAIKQEAIR